MLFALFLIPILVLQYRRFGGFSFSGFLVAAAASIYAVALVSYTLLPLPDPSTLNCAASHTLLQLQPGASLDDIAQVVRKQGRRAALTSPVFLQVVFTVLLFIPFGVIMRRFFEHSIITTTLLGFFSLWALRRPSTRACGGSTTVPTGSQTWTMASPTRPGR